MSDTVSYGVPVGASHASHASVDVDAVADYAAGRWPVAVRTLVLLGAPPRHAAVLATEAISSLFRRCADDEWIDLDAALAAEVVEAWERDRTTWWRRPELRTDHELGGTAVPQALDVLDALSPQERVRFVAGATVGLTADQLNDVLGPATTSLAVLEWSDDLARVAATIPTGAARVAQARGRWAERRREDRGRLVTGLVAALVAVVVAIGVGANAVDPRPASDAAGSPTAPTTVAVDDAGLSPTHSYAGGHFRRAGRTVPVPPPLAMGRVADDDAVTDARGRVVRPRCARAAAAPRCPPGRAGRPPAVRRGH